MQRDLGWIEAVVPDLMPVITRRYQLLQYINWNGPIGRRTLAERLQLSERVSRKETDFLRDQKLIDVSQSGMVLTAKGKQVFFGLEQVMAQLSEVQQVAYRLTRLLGIEHCIVVSGDSDQDKHVLADMGQNVNQLLQTRLPDGDNIITVMGGTTMAQVAQQLTPQLAEKRHLIFVPARGGVGEAVNIQASSVSATMADQTGGDYRVLYIPEQVSDETLAPLLNEPTVREVLKLIDKSQCVIHSIGEAITMAKRRDMSADTIKMLQDQHAVAEAFGYFFDEAGRIVYKIPRIGLQIQDLTKISFVLAVAGGESKAKAIKAYMKNAPTQTWLITDTAAANAILREATLLK